MTASELTERVSEYGSNMGAELGRAVTPAPACRREPTGMSSSMDEELYQETRQLNWGVPGVRGVLRALAVPDPGARQEIAQPGMFISVHRTPHRVMYLT